MDHTCGFKENLCSSHKSDTLMHGVLFNRDILDIRNTKPNKYFNEIVICWLITSESLVSKSKD